MRVMGSIQGSLPITSRNGQENKTHPEELDEVHLILACQLSSHTRIQQDQAGSCGHIQEVGDAAPQRVRVHNSHQNVTCTKLHI